MAVKYDFPVDQVRRFMEPGPIVLVSSFYKNETNIMTMGWHMMMEYTLIGCYIWTENHSFDMIRKSKACVMNIPTVNMAKTVVDIGNSTGAEMNKFEAFGLTAAKAAKVKAPLIAECFANIECKLVDSSLIKKYSLFVFEVVKAHAQLKPKYPETIHYEGDGQFMVSGPQLNLRGRFKPEMLDG